MSAFYQTADVGLVTPLRDGMNLVCKEYVASKVEKKGVLILSEMAGASKELQQAILVNPNNIEEVAVAIKTALTMGVEEQVRRISCMQESLKQHDVFQWVNIFMSRLVHVKQKQVELKSRRLRPLEFQRLKMQFNAAKKPLIILDYDGILLSYGKQSEGAFPDRELKSLIRNLASKALVAIISGRERRILEKLFEHDPVNLMAEHGLWVKRKDTGEGWKALSTINNEWKATIRQTMDYYVLRTPGAFVEEKNSSLVWHHGGSEKGRRNLRTREMLCHLKYLARGYQLQALEGDMTLEVKRSDLNKSKAATTFINEEEFDFILAVGDHWSAEETFKALPSWSFSIRVGDNYTHAKYNVHAHKEIEELLQRLTDEEMLRLVMM